MRREFWGPLYRVLAGLPLAQCFSDFFQKVKCSQMMPSEYIRLCTVGKSQVEDMNSAPEADPGDFRHYWAV